MASGDVVTARPCAIDLEAMSTREGGRGREKARERE